MAEPAPKPLLVGEANPYGGHPGYALWPEPHGCAGQRLCDVIMGIGRNEYFRRFDRTNLCHQAWSMRVARYRAGELLAETPARRLILLGANVCAAFGLEFHPFEQSAPLLLVLPHPSGLSRAWNDPAAYERARAALRAFGVLPVADERLDGPNAREVG